MICTLGCTKQHPPENGSSGNSSNPRTKNVKVACAVSPCEGEAFMRKFNVPNGPNFQQWQKTPFRADEENSLKAALVNTQTTGPEDKLHVYADAIDGRLVFKGGTDHDENVSGNEPELSLGNQNAAATKSRPVKVLATPAALKLLQERAQGSH
jgi:hypothetical protein